MLRLLGVRLSGGSHAHISRQLKRFGTDTSHFTGRASSRGSTGRRIPAAQLLVQLPDGARRTPGIRLKWALGTLGVPQRCAECGVGPVWRDAPLTLHVDHVNGDFLDNRPPNLRLLCPNCHSQTATYAGRNRRAYAVPARPLPDAPVEPDVDRHARSPADTEQVVRAVVAGTLTAVEAARQIGCHRNHVYRLRRRLEETGTVASRARVRVPGQRADRDLVIRYALANPEAGPRRIARLIRDATAGERHPSHGTVSNILRDAGLHTAQARRTRLSTRAGVV